MEPFNSKRPSVYASHAMGATSQPLASLVGIEILKNGGNAIDAAIAIAAMLIGASDSRLDGIPIGY